MTNERENAAPRRFNVEVVDDDMPVQRKAPPPRASWEQGKSVEEAVPAPTSFAQAPRGRNYLAGFRNEGQEDKPVTEATEKPLVGDDLREGIIAALRDIYDPEIPVNIYDLGLIYDILINEGQVTIIMTLTTPNCPVAESMPGEVELRVMAVPGVALCDVDLVWEPAWDPDSMTDEAKLELGLI